MALYNLCKWPFVECPSNPCLEYFVHYFAITHMFSFDLHMSPMELGAR